MKSDVQIGIAALDEAEKIAAVLREAFVELESPYTPEAFVFVTPDAAEIRGRFDEGAIWAALKNERLVGTVSVAEEKESERLYIRSMAVLPSSQSAGIGRKMLEAVEKYAIENGYEYLFLHTLPFLSGATRLYERNGFERGEDTAPEEFFGMAGWKMEKKLNQTGSL